MRVLTILSFSILLLAPSAFAIQARSLPIYLQRTLDSESVEFTQHAIRFNSRSGKELQAKLKVPVARTPDEKFPAILLFGGFEEAAKVLDLVHLDVPVAVASFDYPFNPPRKFEFPSSLKFAPEAKVAVHDTISGIQELHQVLKTRKEIDPNRITIVGASFGAPFALAAAALDTTISGIVVIHGFGDIPGTVISRLMRSWEPKFGIFAHPMAWLLSHVGWLYLNAPNPEDSVMRLNKNQRLLMISAKNDSIIPSASIDSLTKAVEASSASHERIEMAGDHLQPGSDKLISEISSLVSNWMSKSGLR